MCGMYDTFVVILLILLIYEINAATICSVYEVYVKEEGPESKNSDVPGVSGLGLVANHQLSQVINRYNSFIKTESDLQPSKITFKEECVDLGVDSIDSEVINIDSTITKLVGKDALRYKVSAKVRYLKYLSNY